MFRVAGSGLSQRLGWILGIIRLGCCHQGTQGRYLYIEIYIYIYILGFIFVYIYIYTNINPKLYIHVYIYIYKYKPQTLSPLNPKP